MKKFTIYNITTGEVIRSGLCVDTDLELQVQNEREAILEGVLADPRPSYVLDGVVILAPQKPEEGFDFDYVLRQWVDTRTTASQWDLVREERNKKLQQSDWTQLSDIPQETKTLWEPYRQALRDVTLQADPFNITWPTPPQG
jgi:hypothetical protein